MLGMCVLQILQGQSVAFHFFLAFLNPDKVSISRISVGISSRSLDPKIPYHGKHYESVE